MMNITGIQQSAGAHAIGQGQQNQDSHEINIQKQIVTLQEKMRGIAYDNKMSVEEKNDEKKALQEKIQNLNSELKQYQLQKRQEEAEKRQQEAKKQKEAEERKMTESTADTDSSAAGSSVQDTEESESAAEKQETGSPEADAMISMSGAKEHLSNMQQIRTKLESQLRTAPTEEEKAKLQKKIDAISKKMGEKLQKISDTIEDTQKEDKARKEKVKKQLQEYRDKRMNMNASVSKTNTVTESGYWKNNVAMPGKVLLTRKKS